MRAILLFLTLSFLVGCVGVIDDASDKTDKTKLVSKAKIVFAGAVSADVYSHQRVRLNFLPAKGGSGKFSYIAYVNANNTYPVASIAAADADLDESGFLHIIVDDLNKGSTYTFSVKAFDEEYRAEDNNNVVVRATTLNYEVPIFDGIKEALNLAGEMGQTNVKVTWNPAKEASTSSGGWGSNPQAISAYTIWAGTSPDNMSLVGSSNDITKTSYVVTDLTPNTNYYFRVRALNSTSAVDSDLNQEYKVVRTRVPGEPIVFAGLKTASIPTSNLGLSVIDLSWDIGTGDFDRYRIFVSTTAKTAFNPGQDAQFGSDITDLTLTSKQITPGNPHTIYYVALVACKDAACSDYKGHDKVKMIKTSPPGCTI